MSDEQRAYRRVLRRETHSARTTPAVTVAAIVTLALLALAAGGVWSLVDPAVRDAAGAWLARPSIPEGGRAILTIAGAAAVLIALLLVALAVFPGRRARRARVTGRVALVVDDGVLADAVADAVAARCAVAPRQVSATLRRRSVVVRITPTSGIRVDSSRAEDAAVATLADLGFAAAPRVVIASGGVIA